MNLGIQNDNNAITVYCDNQATIAFSKDPKFHSRNTLIQCTTTLEISFLNERYLYNTFLRIIWWLILLQSLFQEMCLLLM